MLQVIPQIIDHHIEEATFTWLTRNDVVKEPHHDLKDLAELDNQRGANLDRLGVAGEAAWQPVAEALEATQEPGETNLQSNWTRQSFPTSGTTL